MPQKNCYTIVVALLISLACYAKAQRVQQAGPLGDALGLIERHYVDSVDGRALMEAAMRGVTDQLDPHSSFIPPAKYEAFQDVLQQHFAGIGILVEQPDPERPVRVITPLVGSPALGAGFLPGDEILRVGQDDVSQAVLPEVSKKLRGPVGTEVAVRVRRQSGEAADLRVRRADIELESVVGDFRDGQSRWVHRLRSDPTIAYIRITSFGERTAREMRKVLSQLDNDFSGMVLDLRDNPGGLMTAATDLCDMFLSSGRIVSTRGRNGAIHSTAEATRGTLVDPDKPLVILIDGNSASASEIVAACLQDHGRAAVAGVRSFGKGTVQELLSLEYGRSALKLTTARYYRPNGRNIHRLDGAAEDEEWGVVPDEALAVPIDEETSRRIVRFWERASYPVLGSNLPPSEGEGSAGEAGPPAAQASSDDSLEIDPQLRRAVEHLRTLVPASPRMAA